MKASELRIGNLVKQGVVESIGNSLIQVSGIIYESEVVEPIELNEDWLFKLGFVNDEEIGYRWYVEWEACVILAYDLDDKCIRVSDTWEFGKREYIHQLQNLYFALTNKELKIN